MEKKIKEKHLEYIENVSARDMAISYELAVYLYRFLKEKKIKTAYDLGSGFSTYIFHLAKVKTITVDTNSLWLQKTKNFIGETAFITFMPYDEFVNSLDYKDLIFLDLANTVRSSALAKVKSKCHYLIGDDYHKTEYRTHYDSILGIDNFQIIEESIDSFGRKSILYINQKQ